jgi:hypothetical protein
MTVDSILTIAAGLLLAAALNRVVSVGRVTTQPAARLVLPFIV